MNFWDLNEDPGSGNLNLRAYIAALVGPRRIAHGRRSVYRVRNSQAKQIAKNGSGTKSVFYIEAWIPPRGNSEGSPSPISFLFSNAQDAVGETGVRVDMTPFQVVPLITYKAVILPGENLYVQLAGPNDQPDPNVTSPQSLVVAEVHF